MNREILKKINWEKELELIGMDEEFESKEFSFNYEFKEHDNKFLNLIMKDFMDKHKNEIFNFFKNKWSSKLTSEGLGKGEGIYEFIHGVGVFYRTYIPQIDRKKWIDAYQEFSNINKKNFKGLIKDFPSLQNVFDFNRKTKKIEIQENMINYIPQLKKLEFKEIDEFEKITDVISWIQKYIYKDFIFYQKIDDLAEEQNKFLYEQEKEKEDFHIQKWEKATNHVINTINEVLCLENKYKNAYIQRNRMRGRKMEINEKRKLSRFGLQIKEYSKSYLVSKEVFWIKLLKENGEELEIEKENIHNINKNDFTFSKNTFLEYVLKPMIQEISNYEFDSFEKEQDDEDIEEETNEEIEVSSM